MGYLPCNLSFCPLRELWVVEVKAWEMQCSMNGQTVQCKHLHHEPTGKKPYLNPILLAPVFPKMNVNLVERYG